MKDKNEAVLCGEIIYTYSPRKNRLLLRLRCQKNHPMIFVCGDLADRILEQYQPGDYIALQCNIQHSIKNDKQTTTIFADRLLSDVIAPQTNFKLHGTVLSVHEKDKGIRIIYVETNTKHYSIVPVVVYFENGYGEIKPHAKIKISGQIQTNRKIVGENKIYYTNFALKSYKIAT